MWAGWCKATRVCLFQVWFVCCGQIITSCLSLDVASSSSSGPLAHKWLITWFCDAFIPEMQVRASGAAFMFLNVLVGLQTGPLSFNSFRMENLVCACCMEVF